MSTLEGATFSEVLDDLDGASESLFISRRSFLSLIPQFDGSRHSGLQNFVKDLDNLFVH